MRAPYHEVKLFLPVRDAMAMRTYFSFVAATVMLSIIDILVILNFLSLISFVVRAFLNGIDL
jgi:hypothetical protein